MEEYQLGWRKKFLIDNQETGEGLVNKTIGLVSTKVSSTISYKRRGIDWARGRRQNSPWKGWRGRSRKNRETRHIWPAESTDKQELLK